MEVKINIEFLLVFNNSIIFNKNTKAKTLATNIIKHFAIDL